MRKLLLIVAGLAIISCANEPKIDYAIVSGKIENPAGKKIMIFNDNFKKEISLQDDGTFLDTLKLDSGYFTFDHGRENTKMYIQPGNDVKITLDTKQFDETLKYEGAGAGNNNYLAAKFLESEKNNFQKMYVDEEDAFLKNIGDIKNKALEALNNAKEVSAEFAALEKEGIEFEYLANLARYPSYHPYFAKKPDYKASKDLLKPLESVDFDNEEDFKNFDAYQQITSQHYLGKFYVDSTKADAIQMIKGLKSQNIKNSLSEELAYAISPSGKDSEMIFNTIKEISDDEKFIEEVSKKYKKLQNLVAGKESPRFDYENYAGGNTTLADLKGKYVYIDVWATWCGPCLGEIPSLKKVEKEYHDKNIHFVSISIDTKPAYDKWRDMIKNKELGGIQLMADNAWQSKFVTDYAIEGIPRFILIGPDGKIVNADAPRPSNPKLIELFNELNI
ncbi:MAG: TlpA disulfide reductase family protein [Bacteroidota bacterium]